MATLKLESTSGIFGENNRKCLPNSGVLSDMPNRTTSLKTGYNICYSFWSNNMIDNPCTSMFTQI